MATAILTGCAVDGCARTHWGRGYCQAHYTRLLRHGDPQAHIPVMDKGKNGPECTVDGCDKKPHALGLCPGHHSRLKLHGDVRATVPLAPSKVEGCRAPDCGRRHSANGYCKLHGRRIQTHGQTDLPVRPPRPACAVPSCDRTVKAGDYCGTHAERIRIRGGLHADRPIRTPRPDQPCDLDGCERPHYCLGFCINHYQQRVSKPRRVALERAAVGDLTAEQLQARIAFYGWRCWMCSAPWTCIDHVKPLARGGSNWPSNLRPACRSCNARKHHRWPYPTSTRKAA